MKKTQIEVSYYRCKNYILLLIAKRHLVILYTRYANSVLASLEPRRSTRNEDFEQCGRPNFAILPIFWKKSNETFWVIFKTLWWCRFDLRRWSPICHGTTAFGTTAIWEMMCLMRRRSYANNFILTMVLPILVSMWLRSSDPRVCPAVQWPKTRLANFTFPI